ncbi:hypothetical protein GGX14DRAFT_572377 [Mycena pura]|uniref:Uncharacterized protein n=1 Tax=Mycena pura TaxID=153505 RepID=A0AAD6V1R3_9AGAR|nr:hypothetical protein GGX14DRAFT_572377 [Mycena pura]
MRGDHTQTSGAFGIATPQPPPPLIFPDGAVQHLPGHYSDLKHSASESDDSNFESVGPPTSETPTKPEAPPKIKLVEEVNYVLTAMASVGLLDVFFFRGHWIGRKAPGGRRVAGL